MVEPWVSIDEVAAHIGVRKDSIYRWIEHRGLPAQKIGKLWKMKLSEVDTWVRARGDRDENVARPRSRNSGDRLVLVIDDEPLVLETVGEFLADEGYGAILATDGVEALQLLAAAAPAPCLIVLDLGMPNMDGWQFREQQSRDLRFSSIPVIVVTADRNAAVDGVVVLRKPLKLDRLAAAMKQLLEET